MDFTGERFVPTADNVEPHFKEKMAAEHLNRYQFASQFVKNKRVLDLGCGVGYGSNFLANNGAKQVIGIDVSMEAIDYGEKNYCCGNLTYRVGSADSLSFLEEVFDVIVCFEMIEHVFNYEGVLKEISRLLAKDGIALISTPQKKETMRSAYHVHEFSLSEFKNLLNHYFPNVQLLTQNPVFGFMIGGHEHQCAGTFDVQFTNTTDIEDSDVYITICSNTPLSGNTYGKINLLNGSYIEYLEDDILILRKFIHERESLIDELRVIEKNNMESIKHLEHNLSEKDSIIRQLMQQFEILQDEKKQQLQQLSSRIENLSRRLG
jgi:ubiquinone/menaquinone biosynthesis C-methylase UbiE